MTAAMASMVVRTMLLYGPKPLSLWSLQYGLQHNAAQGLGRVLLGEAPAAGLAVRAQQQ